MTAKEQQSDSTEVTQITTALLNAWATDKDGPVALHLKQRLFPVETLEGEEGILYPPTYADIGYNIDTLSDGTKVALIDSVGSPANRMEPIFTSKFATKTEDGKETEDWLVPQIEIVLRKEDCGKCEVCKKDKRKKDEVCQDPRKVKCSILELAHRIADAVVHSSPSLKAAVEEAFAALQDSGDAGPLCKLAPTSLVFGVWDSRGSNEKRPRLVRSLIRAWDIDVLHAAAQFNSVWKALSEEQQGAIEKAKEENTKLSATGFADAPATFRKVGKTAAKDMKLFRDGIPNPERRVLGGVLARGRIEREVTLNLVALRGIRGKDDETTAIRKYLLGLSLVAAMADIDLFLREGCNLRFDKDDVWYSIPRRGKPSPVNLASAESRKLVLEFASNAAKHFRADWPKQLEHLFDLKSAKEIVAKNADADSDEEQP